MNATDKLVHALRAAECFSHPVSRVEVRETHISWVLLTGKYAYKIKKPLKLEFLDFSTLELRRHFCEEEVRLNRRFAPDLYLDVVAIRGSLEAPVVAGQSPGPVIEYAVRLLQFDPADELAEKLARNAVTAEEIAALGQRVAKIHAAADTREDYGSAAQTRKIIEDNLQQCEQLQRKLRPGDDAAMAEIRDWMRREFEQLQELIDRRWREGRVRECHGDLHAGNVVGWRGALLPFDCIEFDDKLRCIDIVNDIAFLAMDLDAHNQRPLAYILFNAWLEESGDYDGVQLLRLFQVHRAVVRAKVALLGQHAEESERYMAVADRLCASRTPTLTLTCGLSGSGKTWISSRLLAERGAVRIRSDVERKRLAGLSAQESSQAAGKNIYTPHFNEQVYRRLLECARTCLQAGEHVIVDAAFLKREERGRFMDLAQQLAVPFTILHCTAPVATLRQRLQQRQSAGHDASEADVEVLERQLNYWEPFTPEEQRWVVEKVTK